jgi:hypothetical protein
MEDWPWGTKKVEVQQKGKGWLGWNNLKSEHQMWFGDGYSPIVHIMYLTAC